VTRLRIHWRARGRNGLHAACGKTKFRGPVTSDRERVTCERCLVRVAAARAAERAYDLRRRPIGCKHCGQVGHYSKTCTAWSAEALAYKRVEAQA
jgi:hypothetical protein